MKQTVSEQALALVEKKIPSLAGRLTPQDAATATGITVSEARDALTRLMELYITRVTYDDNGNVLFAFEYPLRRRGTKTAAEKWASAKDALWRGFKVFFKVWIGVMVIGYFIIIAILLLLLLLAQSSSRDDNRGRDRGDNMLSGLFRVMAEGLRFAFWTRAFSPGLGYGYAVDSHGYRYRQVQTPRGVKSNEKSFIIAIYDLALGPERAASDPLENEKEVAAFLRAERGVLTPAEIVELSGGTIAEAEERMADYLVRFNGDPTITEEGVVVGEFESFLLGAEAKADGQIVRYWDEFEAPYVHSGNSGGRNAAILAMVGVTLLGAIILLGGGLQTLAYQYPFLGTGFVAFVIGYIPIAFSLMYFAVSLLRLGSVRRLEGARLERNRKKMVMRVIYQNKFWQTTAQQVHFTLLSLGDKELNQAEVESILGKLVIDLAGDVDLNENGEAVYRFDRLHRETEAAKKLRQ